MNACLEELSARARRGELTESELRQLRLLLASSLEARLVYRAGCEFDAEDSVLAGDDALAQRVTQRLLAQLEPSRQARRRSGWKFAAAAVFAAAAAAAGPTLIDRIDAGSLLGAESRKAAEPASPLPGPGMRHSRGTEHALLPVTSVRIPASAGPLPAESAEPSTSRLVVMNAEQPRASASSDPAELFARASRARRQGHLTQAIALYSALQRRYPAAPEARAADIALGMLYSQRAPSSALTHFRRYSEKGGQLAPEALWGQAQALSALGRTKEARQMWRTLLARYPRSAYANAARAKLGTER